MSGIIFLIVIALILEWLSSSKEGKIQRNIESAHKRAYEKIDEAYGDTLEAREYKADIDTLISRKLKEQNREYKPKDLKQVTTKKEREERESFDREGIRYYSQPASWSVLRLALCPGRQHHPDRSA